jgi:hypothetical protein
MLKLYLMNRHFNNRGVSQVVSALLLIAISVAAAILLYVFAIGLLGSLGTSGGSQTKEELILEAYSFPTVGPVAIAMRDVGPSSINIGGADFFINGVLASLAAGSGTSCVGLTLTPTESCGGSLTLGTMSSLVTGASYPLRVVTPDGGVFSYPITFGGSE